MLNINPLLASTASANSRDEFITAASYKGIILKTILLFLLTFVSGTLVSVFGILDISNTGSTVWVTPKPWVQAVLFVSIFVSFISLLIASLAPKTAVVFAPIYAVSQGTLVGAITTVIAIYMPAIAITAAVSTLALLIISLFFHLSASFRTKQMFVRFSVIFGSVALITILLMTILRFTAPVLFTNKVLSENVWYWLSVAMSVIILIFGVISLINNFNYAEALVVNGLDKKYEMSAAFGFLVSIIWIYFEILRLIILLANIKK